MSNKQSGGERRFFEFLLSKCSDTKKLLQILIAAFIFVAICTLCFPNAFFKILLIVSFILSTYVYAKIANLGNSKDEDETSTSFEFDSINDGFDFIFSDPEDGIKFKDLIVQAPVTELKDLCDYIRNPELFQKYDYVPESKIVLLGGTGSGKSALITAFANETDLPLLRVHASRFFDVEGLLESLFKLASHLRRYIIEIDSFELFASASSNDSSGADIPDVILDKLGKYLETYPNIILFATCDAVATFDAAEMIGKFFKKNIYFSNPNPKERIALLKEFIGEFKLDQSVNFDSLSSALFDFAIGDIKLTVSIAKSLVYKAERDYLTQDDFFNAIDVLLGHSLSVTTRSNDSQKIVAYHEAGHAIADYILSGEKSVLRVISISRGENGGYTLSSINEDSVVSTEQELLDRICVCYAGRCAEKLIFNHLSTGASADIQAATSIINAMINSYGMSSAIGPINVAAKVVLSTAINESNKMLDIAFEECQRIARECEERTMNLLKQHHVMLDTLANYLIEHESITGEEMKELLQNVEA